MELRLSGNINAQDVQMGETNTMAVTYEEKGDILREKDWEELKEFLNMRLAGLAEKESAYALTKKGLDYAEERDEKGLKGFLARNSRMDNPVLSINWLNEYLGGRAIHERIR